jgi:O-antigen/teichoic acid export membrane protein
MNLESDLDFLEVSQTEVTPNLFVVGKTQLARGTAFNFIGQLLPLFAGLGLMRYIVRGLGPDRFGVLGIVWVVFGYFSLFDFGLGRATTKFLAERLAKSDIEHVPALVWTSLAAQVLLGVGGCIALGALTPWLTSGGLKVPPYLAHEVRITFFILAASLPLVLVNNSLRAVLEGCQRFDIVNLLRIPFSALVFIIPAAVLPFGLKLPGIVLLLVASRLVSALAHFAYCIRVLPCLRSWPVFSDGVIRPLIKFGGWVTVGNIVNPILLSMERFLIGSLLSVALVGYYTASFEGVTKLWMIPASLTITIFPACSALGIERKRELALLYFRTMKYLFVVLAPVSLILVLFARQIMQSWLGPDFAAKSSVVLQILAVGVFINCFAQVPYCFIQALGRPRATAILFLLELPPYAAFAWWMVRHGGIAGAATAWSVRVAIEALLLMLIAWKLFSLSPREFLGKEMLTGFVILGVTALAVVATQRMLQHSSPMQICMAAVWLAGLALANWKLVLDDLDRGSILTLLNPLRSQAMRARDRA